MAGRAVPGTGYEQQRRAPAEREKVSSVFALIVGLVLVAVGLIGFVATGFGSTIVADTDDELLGLDLNIFHNIVNIAIGAGLIIASRLSDAAVTQGIVIGIGLFLVVAALLGFLDYLQILSIDGSLAVNNFLFLVAGVLAVIVGLIAASQHEEARETVTRTPMGMPEEREPPRTPAGMPASAEGPAPIEERRALWDRDETFRERTY